MVSLIESMEHGSAPKGFDSRYAPKLIDVGAVHGYTPSGPRGHSSVGRALQSHCRGRGFESPCLHPIDRKRRLEYTPGGVFLMSGSRSAIICLSLSIFQKSLPNRGKTAPSGAALHSCRYDGEDYLSRRLRPQSAPLWRVLLILGARIGAIRDSRLYALVCFAGGHFLGPGG